MAYIGKSPTGTGVRSRFYYTQTSGGGTSISGTDDNSKTLTFTDGEYIDVFLNGVLLVAGTDYNTNTANTISGLAALANGDVVEVVVYDIFTVADTVSASQGGTFNSSVTVNRPSSDGDVIIIQKDGTQTGAITTNGDDTVEIYGEGSAKTGLRFGGSSLIPLKNAGALSDNGVDLGTSSYRFNDAYLGGNLYIGGTGSANALDDYEEGTFTVTMTPGGGSITENSSDDLGLYTKVGRLVCVSGRVTASSVSSPTGELYIGGFPFGSSDDHGENSGSFAAAVFVWNATQTNNGLWIGFHDKNTNSVILRWGNTATPGQSASYVQAGTEVRFTVTYHTDS